MEFYEIAFWGIIDEEFTDAEARAVEQTVCLQFAFGG